MKARNRLSNSAYVVLIPFFILMFSTGCTTMTPLTEAAYEGDLAKLNRHLAKGVNINESNKGNWQTSPLGWALYNCKLDAAELLLKKGASVNIHNTSGETPLILAVKCGTDAIELIKIIIDKGGDINALDHSGSTPLRYAVQYNYGQIAELLIKAGADNKLYDVNEKQTIDTNIDLIKEKKIFETKQDLRKEIVTNTSTEKTKIHVRGEKAKIAIIELQNLNEEAKKESLGAILSEMLTTSFVNSDAFKITEREQLQKVTKELQLSHSGIIDISQAKQVGKMVGADAIVTGSVTKIGNALRLDARIIDVQSGIILIAEKGEAAIGLSTIGVLADQIAENIVFKYYREKK
jgi:TolB-like protein